MELSMGASYRIDGKVEKSDNLGYHTLAVHHTAACLSLPPSYHPQRPVLVQYLSPRTDPSHLRKLLYLCTDVRLLLVELHHRLLGPMLLPQHAQGW
jgi:hypothetical protein